MGSFQHVFGFFEDVRLTLYEIVKEQKIVFRHSSLFGPERARTADPLLAKQVLYQLSYRPIKIMGQRGIAPLTPALSALCSAN